MVTVVKAARQRLFNIRMLMLTALYRSTIKRTLSGCITARYGNSTAADRKALQKMLKRAAERTTGSTLPALQDTYTTRCRRKAKKIIRDPSDPSHALFYPLQITQTQVEQEHHGKNYCPVLQFIPSGC